MQSQGSPIQRYHLQQLQHAPRPNNFYTYAPVPIVRDPQPTQELIAIKKPLPEPDYGIGNKTMVLMIMLACLILLIALVLMMFLYP